MAYLQSSGSRRLDNLLYLMNKYVLVNILACIINEILLPAHGRLGRA